MPELRGAEYGRSVVFASPLTLAPRNSVKGIPDRRLTIGLTVQSRRNGLFHGLVKTALVTKLCLISNDDNPRSRYRFDGNGGAPGPAKSNTSSIVLLNV